MVALGDSTIGAVEYALRGLQQRADVRANNVANHNTPGFRAMRVDFERELQGALVRGGSAPVATPAARPDMSLPNPNTNNSVDLETELTGMLKDNLQRDAMINAFNAKTSMLRAAITGR